MPRDAVAAVTPLRLYSFNRRALTCMFSLLKHDNVDDDEFTGFIMLLLTPSARVESDDFLLLRFFLRLSVDMTRLFLFSFRLFTSESIRFSADDDDAL